MEHLEKKEYMSFSFLDTIWLWILIQMYVGLCLIWKSSSTRCAGYTFFADSLSFDLLQIQWSNYIHSFWTWYQKKHVLEIVYY